MRTGWKTASSDAAKPWRRVGTYSEAASRHATVTPVPEPTSIRPTSEAAPEVPLHNVALSRTTIPAPSKPPSAEKPVEVPSPPETTASSLSASLFRNLQAPHSPAPASFPGTPRMAPHQQAFLKTATPPSTTKKAHHCEPSLARPSPRRRNASAATRRWARPAIATGRADTANETGGGISASQL